MSECRCDTRRALPSQSSQEPETHESPKLCLRCELVWWCCLVVNNKYIHKCIHKYIRTFSSAPEAYMVGVIIARHRMSYPCICGLPISRHVVLPVSPSLHSAITRDVCSEWVTKKADLSLLWKYNYSTKTMFSLIAHHEHEFCMQSSLYIVDTIPGRRRLRWGSFHSDPMHNRTHQQNAHSHSPIHFIIFSMKRGRIRIRHSSYNSYADTHRLPYLWFPNERDRIEAFSRNLFLTRPTPEMKCALLFQYGLIYFS